MHPVRSLRALASLIALAIVPSLARADLPPGPPHPPPPPPASPSLTMALLPLPGHEAVWIDYYAWEPATRRLFVPTSGSGRVDVVDPATMQVQSVAGFATKKVGERAMGPSSATVGDGVVWVGDRADQSVCAIDAKTLTRAGCVKLPAMPDGVSWVAPTREVWVTTPGDKSLTIVDGRDARAPKVVGRIALAGEPEGYAVDALHGRFYTNLEDGDRTLAVDVRARKVVATWEPRCGSAGPRGLALDVARNLVFVACTEHVVSLDTGSGAPRGQLPIGPGIDNIDYSTARHELWVAAGREATVVVATVDEHGALARKASAATSPGARVVVLDGNGDGWVADGRNARLLRFTAPR